MEAEPTLATQRIYQGRVVGLRVDTVQLPNGLTSQREIVEHGPSVVIVPLDEQDRVLLVRQFRKAVERTLLELPAGGLHPGESPQEAALRELQEETGYLAQQLEPLGGFYASPGYCQEYLHLFLASHLLPSPLPADEDEHIQVERVPLAQTPQLIASGEICDSKSAAGLLRVILR